MLWPLHVPRRRKTFTFAISSSDEFLCDKDDGSYQVLANTTCLLVDLAKVKICYVFYAARCKQK